ncbi:Fic family protein [Cytobacillus sp. IB215665]|uniref:Fic family protein n=1 Tax=Cytobacillus sp. IB215665 TaxID=3097357 RepID=UPI002A0D28C3|nr:Fic family protein [Cytobacillus sp. IB215665]MDX8367212.1 Fic family protein [Cytobacillus sp. IB215665]
MELDSYRPLPHDAIDNLRNVYRVEMTYHSNAIEGNTLSLIETKMVIEEGLTIGGKQLREHFEAINHSEAIDFIEEHSEKDEPISEATIKDIHYLILKNIDNTNAGKYRQINVRISGSEHTPPHFLQVENEMKKLIDWYNLNKNVLHPVELAALFHFKFVFIHSFSDGNGRTSRLLMNLILMKFGYPPAIIKADSTIRLEYYNTLEIASVNNNTEPFVNLIAMSVEESINRYLDTVR